jgi:monoamine oxidase
VFEPRIEKKERAAAALAMGPVVKVTLEFRSEFWPHKNFGFIHAVGCRFPTWWSDQRGALLTGWAGGPRAHRFAGMDLEGIRQEAVRAVANMFKIKVEQVTELLVSLHRHDWSQDPFSRGAYSTPYGMGQMAAQLASPVENTLFFAGEATDSEGEEGTVHGALGSGQRAAREMIEALRLDQSQRNKSKRIKPTK